LSTAEVADLIAMLLTVGRVTKAQGTRGEVVVDLRTDDPQKRFAPGAVLITDPVHVGPLTVGRTRWQGTRLVVRFRNVPDRAAADALRGVRLLVDVPDDARPPDPDEYYDYQIIGLHAVTVAGGEIGEVTEVVHLPSQELLAIRRPDGDEVMVPFVKAIVPEVDLAGRRLVVDPPEGLLDLGAVE
jgi:16S rRNA processing protein RimM